MSAEGTLEGEETGMALVKLDVTTVGEAVVTVKLDVMVASTLEPALAGGVTNVRAGSTLTGMFLLAGEEALSLEGMELAHT